MNQPPCPGSLAGWNSMERFGTGHDRQPDQAVAGGSPGDGEAGDVLVVVDDLVLHQQVEERLHAVVDVGLTVHPLGVEHDHHGAVDRGGALLAQPPAGVAFPVAVLRRLRAALAALVQEQVVGRGRQRQLEENDGRRAGGLPGRLAHPDRIGPDIARGER
jgi:hypothetical protein